MTKLFVTQALIPSAAARRPEHVALPLPESLRGSASAKVVGTMFAKSLLREVDADLRKGDPVSSETGQGVWLVATDAGLAAIGIETEDANPAPAGTTNAPTEEAAPDTPTEPKAAPKTRTPREDIKHAALIAMLRAPDGATIEEIMVTLRRRLAKLEATRRATVDGPSVTVHNIVWQTEDAGLRSVATFARVLTPSGWETIARAKGETDAEFSLRAEAMAGIQPAASQWVLGELRKKHGAV